jgi:DNA-binding NtrC family response regulator
MNRQPVVLLVAGDGLTRLITSNGLSMYGYEVVTARDAAEAADALGENRRIGVLVVDADLAGETDGLAIAQNARRLDPKIDVIYTSRNPYRIPEKAKVKGAPCIRAPYHPQQIVGIISELKHRPTAEPGMRVA